MNEEKVWGKKELQLAMQKIIVDDTMSDCRVKAIEVLAAIVLADTE